MAAPVAAFVQLPIEQTNFDKKVRSQTRVVGSDTVHEHFYTMLNTRQAGGMYYVSSGLITPPSSADNGTTTARFWLTNPPGSPVRVAVHSIKYSMGLLSLATTADATAQRLAFALFTCTGIPSGTATLMSRRDGQDVMPVSMLTVASTGLTVTLGNIFRADIWPTLTNTTGLGNATPYMGTERDTTAPDRGNAWDEALILRPGEGLVCYCPDAGTASTNRRGTVDLIIEEAA